MPPLVEVGTVAGREQTGKSLWLVHLDLPQLAPQVQPGQVLLVRCTDPEYPAFDPFLPRAYFVFAVDRSGGRLSLLVALRGRGSSWLTGRQEGGQVAVHGPIGRPITPARLTRHLLLLADSTVGVAALALAADAATRRGCAVTLVENAAREEQRVPARLLRADVEYRAASPAAGGLLGVLPALLPWADEVVIAAAPPLLETLASLRRARLAPFTLHANVPLRAIPLLNATSGGDAMPCGSGVCGACAVPTRGGTRLLCQDGPAFPLEDLRLDTTTALEDEGAQP